MYMFKNISKNSSKVILCCILLLPLYGCNGPGNELFFGKKKIGVLISPYATAIAHDYKLYVTDTSEGTVHIFDLRKRQYRHFGEIDNNKRLQKPVGITVSGNWIYVVDSMLHKVCIFNTAGKFLFSFGDDRLKRPSGIVWSRGASSDFLPAGGQT
jgi:DNA-binding beta-propeller fold protein YncE